MGFKNVRGPHTKVVAAPCSNSVSSISSGVIKFGRGWGRRPAGRMGGTDSKKIDRSPPYRAIVEPWSGTDTYGSVVVGSRKAGGWVKRTY